MWLVETGQGRVVGGLCEYSDEVGIHAVLVESGVYFLVEDVKSFLADVKKGKPDEVAQEHRGAVAFSPSEACG